MEIISLVIIAYGILFYFDILPFKFDKKIEPSIPKYYIKDATADKVVEFIMSNISNNIYPFKIEYIALIEHNEISKLIQSYSIDTNIHICYNDNKHGVTVNIFCRDEEK